MKFADTNNELTNEVGGYEHVVVLEKIKVVDGELVEALQQLPRGTYPGDCILCNTYVQILSNAYLGIQNVMQIIFVSLIIVIS